MTANEIFIRLDKKGTWKDKEHISSHAAYECDPDFAASSQGIEAGISCYRLVLNDQDYITSGLEHLAEYWKTYAGVTDEALDEFQVTIFRGNLVPNVDGSDGEDLAECTETIAVIDDARSFMTNLYKVVFDLYIVDEVDEEEKDEITQDDYEKTLKEMVGAYV